MYNLDSANHRVEASVTIRKLRMPQVPQEQTIKVKQFCNYSKLTTTQTNAPSSNNFINCASMSKLWGKNKSNL